MAYAAQEIRLASHPEGIPAEQNFIVADIKLDTPKNGELLVENHYFSADPALRRPLSDGTIKPGFALINPNYPGFAVGKVLESHDARFAAGDFISHGMSFCTHAVVSADTAEKITLEDEPLSAHLGVLGITGITAYAGMLRIGEVQDGEQVFVSAAAGATGSVAAQIAKIKNCYVVGSAGSQDKCDWLTGVAGLDGAINYKDGVLRKSIKAAFPNGIDVYYDNVGGEHLNATLPRMNLHGRVAACGMISAYNDPMGLTTGVTTLSVIMYKRITIKGFTVTDHFDMQTQFMADMRRWIREGKMKWEETLYEGIENAPKAIIGLMTGNNLGKSVVKL